MTFKQNTKMNASGSHYCGGGKVKKMAIGGIAGKLGNMGKLSAFAHRNQPAPVTPVNIAPIPQKAAAMPTNIAPIPQKVGTSPVSPTTNVAPSGVQPLVAKQLPGGTMAIKKGGKVTRGNKKK